MDQHSQHSMYVEWVRELVARAHEITVRSREILRLPVPDTFLGRKTQEPFPNEDE